MNDKNQGEAKFRGWFRHANGEGYSMLVKGAETFAGAAEACSVEEEAGGVKCMSIERIPNAWPGELLDIIVKVKKAMLIGADPNYFTDHGQMEDAVMAVREILGGEIT